MSIIQCVTYHTMTPLCEGVASSTRIYTRLLHSISRNCSLRVIKERHWQATGDISVRRQSMKLVCAIVKPFKLDQVLDSMERIGIRSLTVTETKGYGQKGQTQIFRGTEFTAKFLPMIKIEVAVATHRLEEAIRAIQRAAKTGRPGDGKIFVSDLDQVLSIRTGVIEETTPPLAA
jgi:nitrogen regulatory protein PII